MSVQSTCPACGAQLSVDEGGGKVTCPYCGSSFNVDMSAVQPAFKVSENAPAQEPQLQIIPPEVPPEYNSTDAGPTGQPLTGEVVHSTFGTRAQVSFFGNRWWVVILVVVLGAFCLSCACLVLIVQRVFH